MKLFTNWKTTSAGIVAFLAGISALTGDLSTMVSAMMFDFTKLLTDIGMISAGFVGIFGKDFNVTGGTTRQ